MALETGTYISDLVATNPLSSDLKSQGDDHLRLLKSTIKNTFPNVTGEVSATHTALNAANKGRNKIINGDFLVWQRGTSFVSIANLAYSADRWFYGKSGTAVHNIGRSTEVPTVAQSGQLFSYSLLLDCTTADTSIAAGDYVILNQYIEGFNFKHIAQRAMVFSFWVKATKTGTYCVAFRNSGRDRSYVAEYSISATETWEKKTVSISASPSAGTWDYDTGTGLSVTFTIASGSTFQTTADTWQTGDYFATANQVNGADSASNNFKITGVQIESGSDVTEFENRTYSDVLSDCQRYYWKGLPCNQLNYPSYSNTSIMTWPVAFPVTMRVAPTLTVDFAGISLTNTGTPTAANPQTNGFKLLTQATAVTSNAFLSFVAGNYIAADAEL